jgi:hypothetical protein
MINVICIIAKHVKVAATHGIARAERIMYGAWAEGYIRSSVLGIELK